MKEKEKQDLAELAKKEKEIQDREAAKVKQELEAKELAVKEQTAKDKEALEAK
jgi:hypothetical protein